MSNVLVVNAGSSSVKLRLVDGSDQVRWSADLPAGSPDLPAGEPDLAGALDEADAHGGVDAVGHRFVHGATVHTDPVVLNARVEAELRDLTSLAPLHQPAALAGVAAVRAARPRLPQVACFDTAFHASLSPAAATYAVPASWRDRYRVRRYGFHGLSYAWAVRRAATMTGRPVDGLRLVICHLGAGASLAAVRDGRGVDTTMGFTPLEGLVMATRAGTVDPGLILWLQENVGLSAAEIGDALEHRSGLLALAGTGDMRQVTAGVARGEPAAVLALAVYTHRLRGLIGSMVAAARGLDVLVFTGGVGEGSAEVRAAAVEGLDFLGLRLDPVRNAAATADADLTAVGAAARTLVITAREDLEIARGARSALVTAGGRGSIPGPGH
ncbi:MAG: acetate/propionate family kinase [Frankia sp.]